MDSASLENICVSGLSGYMVHIIIVFVVSVVLFDLMNLVYFYIIFTDAKHTSMLINKITNDMFSYILD